MYCRKKKVTIWQDQIDELFVQMCAMAGKLQNESIMRQVQALKGAEWTRISLAHGILLSLDNGMSADLDKVVL